MNFESKPNSQPEKPSLSQSDADERVMSRRNFLKVAGATALGAALESIPEESQAQERKKESISLKGFTLDEFEVRKMEKKIERSLPGATAEFFMSKPWKANLEKNHQETFFKIGVILTLPNGDTEEGEAMGFYGSSRPEIIASQALDNALEKK